MIYRDWNEYVNNITNGNRPIREIYRGGLKVYSHSFKQNEPFVFTIDTEEDLSEYETIDLTLLVNYKPIHYLSARTDYESIYFNDFSGDVSTDFLADNTGLTYIVDDYLNTLLITTGITTIGAYVNSGISLNSSLTYKLEINSISTEGLYYEFSGDTGYTAINLVDNGSFIVDYTGTTGLTYLIFNIETGSTSVDYIRLYENLNNDESINFTYRDKFKFFININKDITKNIPCGDLSLTLGLNSATNRIMKEYTIGNIYKNFSRY
jgi:hypothetical protein